MSSWRFIGFSNALGILSFGPGLLGLVIGRSDGAGNWLRADLRISNFNLPHSCSFCALLSDFRLEGGRLVVHCLSYFVFLHSLQFLFHFTRGGGRPLHNWPALWVKWPSRLLLGGCNSNILVLRLPWWSKFGLASGEACHNILVDASGMQLVHEGLIPAPLASRRILRHHLQVLALLARRVLAFCCLRPTLSSILTLGHSWSSRESLLEIYNAWHSWGRWWHFEMTL